MIIEVVIGKKRSGRTAWLDAPAAAAYGRMLQGGCPGGGITDAGRTNAEQWVLWRKFLAGELKATAAFPGTSKHESGRALDLAFDVRGDARAWVRAHGRAFGWLKDRVANEPWHMEYVASLDQHGARLVSNPTTTTLGILDVPVLASPAPLIPITPPPLPEEDDDMRDQIMALYLRRWGQLPTAADLARQLEIGALAADKPAFFEKLDSALRADGRFADFAALGSDAARESRINEVAKAAGWV